MAKKKPEQKQPKPKPPEPERVMLEFVHPCYGHRHAASVPGIGDDVWYLDEYEFSQEEAAERIASGDWQPVNNKCKHVKLNGERCDKDRIEGERHCDFHLRMYAPGKEVGEAGKG